MSNRDLLTGLHSFLPSCLRYQPRDSLIAEIRSFPLGNPKDGSHAFHISLDAGGPLHQIGKSGRGGDVPLPLELGSCECSLFLPHEADFCRWEPRLLIRMGAPEGAACLQHNPWG